MTNKIDEKTLIPISLLIIIIGGVAWLSNINAKVNESEKKLDEIAVIRKELQEQAKSLARIEGALGTKVNDQ